MKEPKVTFEIFVGAEDEHMKYLKASIATKVFELEDTHDSVNGDDHVRGSTDCIYNK